MSRKHFPREEKLNQLRLIASRDGRDGSVVVHQDVDLYASILQSGVKIRHEIAEPHKVFVQVIEGEVTVNGEAVRTGDGVQVSGETALHLEGYVESEMLVFDMG